MTTFWKSSMKSVSSAVIKLKNQTEKDRKPLSRSRVFMSELHIISGDGQLRWIHICGKLLKAEQELPCLRCIFHNVTDARDRQEDG